MQIILASAKIMNSKTAVSVPEKTVSVFSSEAERFALEMSSWDVETLAKRLNCSNSIALENQLRFQSFFNDDEKLPALLAYNGHAYKHLQASSFTESDFRFAQHHLFITSFLYGLLRPLDQIHPYRMEAKVTLKATQHQNMFAFWRPLLTDMLIDAVKQDDGILIHLATEEYEHLFDWKRICREVKVIQPLFYVEKGDKMKVVSVYAKQCRGAMTRCIIRHQWHSPQQLLTFNEADFVYQPNYGDELHPHFILNQT